MSDHRLLPDLTEDEHHADRLLIRAGFRRVLTDPDTQLTEWQADAGIFHVRLTRLASGRCALELGLGRGLIHWRPWSINPIHNMQWTSWEAVEFVRVVRA